MARRRKHTKESPIASLAALALMLFAWALLSGNTENALIIGMVCGTGLVLLVVVLVAGKWLSHKVQKRERRAWLQEQARLDQLLALTPIEFEERCAQLFRDMGHRAQVMGGSGDDGIDVVVDSKQGRKWIVQCKRYAPGRKVGAPTVRDLAGAMLHEHADRAVLITTSEFTAPAQSWADGKKIKLLDGHSLVQWIDKARTGQMERT